MSAIEYVKKYYNKFKELPSDTRVIFFSIATLFVVIVVIIVIAYLNVRTLDRLGLQINTLDKKIDAVDSKFGRALTDSTASTTDSIAIYNHVISATVLVVNQNAVARLQQNPAGTYTDLTFLGESYGTGFFISPDGIIATAAHVIESVASTTKSLIVVTDDGQFHEAKIIKEDKNSDLAILKINGGNFPALDLGYQDNVAIGDRVGIAGYGGGYNFPLVHTGTISGRFASSSGAFVLVNAFVNRGNSGGPIFLLNTGRVIAIVGARKNEPLPEGLVELPPNYGSGFSVGGLDPVLLTVGLYNKMVKNVSVTSQFGDGIGYSVNMLRNLISGIK